MARWTERNIKPQTGRIAVITGANAGIGFETARALVQAGAHCIFACRNQQKAEKAMARIAKIAGIKSDREKFMESIPLDLRNIDSVRKFCSTFTAGHNKLHFLINNAGFMRITYSNSDPKDSETQFSINHMGHFALTALLFPSLKAAENEDARIITVSSLAHTRGNIDFDAIIRDGGMDYNHDFAYSNSKLANLLFTYELQRRLDSHGIALKALAAHPGLASTSIAEHMKISVWNSLSVSLVMGLVAQSARRGALPTLRAALDDSAKPGSYYGPSGLKESRGYPVEVRSNERSHSKEDARRLWEMSEQITGVRFNWQALERSPE